MVNISHVYLLEAFALRILPAFVASRVQQAAHALAIALFISQA